MFIKYCVFFPRNLEILPPLPRLLLAVQKLPVNRSDCTLAVRRELCRSRTLMLAIFCWTPCTFAIFLCRVERTMCRRHGCWIFFSWNIFRHPQGSQCSITEAQTPFKLSTRLSNSSKRLFSAFPPRNQFNILIKTHIYEGNVSKKEGVQGEMQRRCH